MNEAIDIPFNPCSDVRDRFLQVLLEYTETFEEALLQIISLAEAKP